MIGSEWLRCTDGAGRRRLDDPGDFIRLARQLDSLPAVREAAPNTLLVAGGTSCRHQIGDATGRTSQHVARILARALET